MSVARADRPRGQPLARLRELPLPDEAGPPKRSERVVDGGGFSDEEKGPLRRAGVALGIYLAPSEIHKIDSRAA